MTKNPLKGSYRLNEQIKLIGNAKAFSGANITDANVTYRVVRNTIYPYYPYYSRGFMPPQGAEMEIINGTTATSDTGSFQIVFKAIPDKQVSAKQLPVYSYTIYTDVTDVNGETHSAETSVSVGTNALNLEVPIPEVLNNEKDVAFPIHKFYRLHNLNKKSLENAIGNNRIYIPSQKRSSKRIFQGMNMRMKTTEANGK